MEPSLDLSQTKFKVGNWFPNGGKSREVNRGQEQSRDLVQQEAITALGLVTRRKRVYILSWPQGTERQWKHCLPGATGKITPQGRKAEKEGKYPGFFLPLALHPLSLCIPLAQTS
jgi:hypothetical protein